MVVLTIIIASFNRGKLLEETLRSIRDQRHKLDHEILIIDNVSTDCTQEVIDRYHALPIVLVRERDYGLYSAIAKGIRMSSGEYVCYINCGDLFDPYYFSIVRNIEKARDYRWYIGLPTSRTKDYATNMVRTDFYTSSRLIRMGYHNGRNDHFLQQESIFWHRRLNKQIDLEKLASFKLAGDAYLWLNFATVAEPLLLGASISGYTHHENALSDNRSLYMREFDSIYGTRSRIPFLLLVISSAKKIHGYLGRLIDKALSRLAQ